MSKVFDTVNIHKLTLANIPNIIMKFIANHIKEQQDCPQYNGTLPKLKRINIKVLSPTLFNIYTFDIPLPLKDIQITTYANDILITASHIKHCKAQQLIQPYLQKIYEWATTNNLNINTNKTIIRLFMPDPAEYGTTPFNLI